MVKRSLESVTGFIDRAVTGCGRTLLLAVFAFTSNVFGQGIKAEVASAFVWGEDTPSGAISSTIQDPLTGHAIRKLTYGPIEVSSQIGFERVSPDEAGTYLNYRTTIINGSDSMLSVQYGGISIDGKIVSLPWVILPGKKLSKRERKNKTNMIEAEKLQCFRSSFLSHDHTFSVDGALETLHVAPKTALTVSSVFRDPRSYPLRCSVEGCHPIGTIRYYLTVNSQDYVFSWLGQSAIYCGR